MIRHWLRCPYCGVDDPDEFDVDSDYEHFTVECRYCHSSFKQYHGGGQYWPDGDGLECDGA